MFLEFSDGRAIGHAVRVIFAALLCCNLIVAMTF